MGCIAGRISSIAAHNIPFFFSRFQFPSQQFHQSSALHSSPHNPIHIIWAIFRWHTHKRPHNMAQGYHTYQAFGHPVQSIHQGVQAATGIPLQHQGGPAIISKVQVGQSGNAIPLYNTAAVYITVPTSSRYTPFNNNNRKTITIRFQNNNKGQFNTAKQGQDQGRSHRPKTNSKAKAYGSDHKEGRVQVKHQYPRKRDPSQASHTKTGPQNRDYEGQSQNTKETNRNTDQKRRRIQHKPHKTRKQKPTAQTTHRVHKDTHAKRKHHNEKTRRPRKPLNQ